VVVLVVLDVLDVLVVLDDLLCRLGEWMQVV
jgi:hypothetical protein